MKRTSALMLIILALPIILSAQSAKKNQGDTRVEQQLRDLVRAWDDADVKGDTVILDLLLADEFSFVGGPTKAEYLASFKTKSPDSTVDSAVSTDVRVQVYGNAAIVTGVDTIAGKNKGQSYANKWLYMDVWIKRRGRWQCVKTYSNLARN